ncbi:C40 family peptidase [Neisseria chenwenguii]|uniref:Uncharacterized protein n=1 Tax=Neisseria chenwenguii TaxID=1853278 RepID=A0A220S2D3_9NEIS|nr:hypothetical protein [Neisseria chenwenguii]ASK27634.1 hypothetical protein BG910_07650 [Neisseria chenwenguii]ROV54436.1 hypothetical protein EGS38_11195 [Neisseria chenwenguii]
MAVVQITPFNSSRFFCSQFVVEAFNRAYKPLTDTEPEWITPSDILNMREGDVPSVTPCNQTAMRRPPAMQTLGLELELSGTQSGGVTRPANQMPSEHLFSDGI